MRGQWPPLPLPFLRLCFLPLKAWKQSTPTYDRRPFNFAQFGSRLCQAEPVQRPESYEPLALRRPTCATACRWAKHACFAPRTVRWKGSEGSKQTKHTTRKLMPWWFQKCNFLKIYLRPFFGNDGFVKFGTFSVLLALPVMIREGYGQYEVVHRSVCRGWRI